MSFLPKHIFRLAKILTLILASLACSSIDNFVPSALPEKKDTFFIDRHGIPMALVPAGPFEMGSFAGDDDELPVHMVMLNDFYIDQYEVTNSHYDACLKAGACEPTTDTSAFESSYSRGMYYGNPEYSDYPVIMVNWFEAQQYCAWRSARLPTEAEWEKAARGGLENKLYPWGDEAPLCESGAENGARFDDNVECNNSDTQQVGTYSANGYHLYDMAGNVWEWVIDYYDENYYTNSPTDGPTGPENGNYPVLRGGSWNSSIDHMRVSDRRFNDAKSGSYNIGFRCVREDIFPPIAPEDLEHVFSPVFFSAIFP
ncbi:MAG TPA: formylglycine-generating enzyme family protein [Anaerolineales bacterium]|nr:formylglycine-generating enzyme family protein [Anaerolineales bacterium]